MNGYNQQHWQQPYGYQNGNPQNFFDQLQQHASQDQHPYHSQQSYQSQPYHQPYQQQFVPPQAEFMTQPQRPQYQNYAQAQSQPIYPQRYDQPYPPQQFQSQQIYRQPLQLDGSVATDHDMPAPQPQSQPIQTPLQSLQNGVHNTQNRPTESPKIEDEPEPNYGQLLLVLADEYMMATEKVEKNSDEYFKLLSFALGCIESALENYQLPPLKTAQVSLTYVRLLYEHTENFDEAEKATTKAIEICQQNNYLDLKYALTLLSVRLLYQTKPKAALKFLSEQIKEMEAYRHIAWIYVFYYEAVSLSLTQPTRDLHHAISQLEKLEQIAARHHDKAVVYFAALMSAMIHLQTSHTDAISSAQQAIARSRTEQLDPSLASLPQLRITTEFIDLCCSMRSNNVAEGDKKRVQMQEVWGEVSEHDAWNLPGTLYLPIHASSLRESPLQAGGLVVKHNGEYALPFTWFTKQETEQLCYLMCTTSKAHRNSSDSFKSEAFCQEGLRLIRKDHPGTSAIDREVLECRFLIEFAFLLCMRSEWAQASGYCSSATKIIRARRTQFPKSMIASCQYINGVLAQATGQLDKAMQAWNNSLLKPEQFIRQPDPSQPNQPLTIIRPHDLETTVLQNLSILTLINRLFILDDPSHPLHHTRDRDLAFLSAFAKSHPQDRNITTACTLAVSLLTNSGIWVSKERLIKALNEAKAINNQQLTALILALMQQAFFLGATDQHAQQCVKAASVQVRSWRHQTWLHVMDGVWAEALGYLGKLDEQRVREEDARRSWEVLPEGLRRAVDWSKEPVKKSVAKKV